MRLSFGRPFSALFFLLAAGRTTAAAGTGAGLDPDSWNYGVRPQRYLIERTVRVRPPAGARVRIGFVQIACSCLKARVLREEGTADSPAEIRVTMDTEDLRGRTRHSVFIQLAGPAGETLRLRVTGWVRTADGPGRVEVFFAETEPAGRRFLDWWRRASPRWEPGAAAGVLLRPIEDLENYRRLRELERKAALKGPACEVAAFVDSKLVLRGEAEVRAGLSGFLNLERDGRPAPLIRSADTARGAAPLNADRGAEPLETRRKPPSGAPSFAKATEDSALRAYSAEAASAAKAGSSKGAKEGARLEVELYYFSDCRRCREVLALLRRVAAELGGRAEVATKDLDLDPGAVPLVHARLRLYPGIPRVLPSMVLFAGDRVVLGEKAILENAREVIASQLALGGPHLAIHGSTELPPRRASAEVYPPGRVRPAAPAKGVPSAEEIGEAIGLVTVIAAALADGVNPCAFAAMVLLVSVLSVPARGGAGEESAGEESAGGRRKPARHGRALLIGGASFVTAVFATYFLAGLGLFAGLRALDALPLAERIVFWLVWALALAGGVLSGVDAVTYFRTRDPERLRLKVPEGLRRRFAPLLRRRFSSLGLVAGGVAGGFLISILEGVCTGQMYLPTIRFMARLADLRARWIAYLALYNLLFVLPLVAILGAAVAGVHFRRLNALLRRHLGWTKVALAIVFSGLAAVMLLGRWTRIST